MARFSTVVLRRYLLGEHLPTGFCGRRLRQGHRCVRPVVQSLCSQRYHATQAPSLASDDTLAESPIPFRKQLKDDGKKKKLEETAEKKSRSKRQALDDWELTVGVEIHAQLNTSRKLFSSAKSTIEETPNSHVAFFDLAIPGSQPIFQKETLIPALRAALALNCDIQKSSKFDRKHYFHWDQPAGYQITQYYKPFAKDGCITLYSHDGIAKEDGDKIQIGIKQIQMEQDTAKTISLPGDVHLLDFNRVGLPLIEIITLPQIHHPSTAAALVRKLQKILKSIDACVLGMESGGLRADVNVSVRRRGTEGACQYSGIVGLGQRTEIKNLSSFKAVEDAIVAERDRQISILQSGGVIESETRGWTIGSSETVRLRGKEGEVDYRYMPDPDIPPVVIGEDLVNHLRTTLGCLPDEEIKLLVDDYGLTVKDAMSIISLEEGGRVEFFRDVVDEYLKMAPAEEFKTMGKLCANWVLHEMGGLSHDQAEETNPLGMDSDGRCVVPALEVAKLLHYLQQKRITGQTAKRTLNLVYSHAVEGGPVDVKKVLDEGQLWFTSLSDEEYRALAESFLDMKVVRDILAGQEGKINFLLGKMMKNSGGKVDPQQALDTLRKVIEEHKMD